MFEETKRQIIKAGMSLDRYVLIALSGGNVSVRMPSGEILVTPSGMIYEDLVEDDILVMDLQGKIIEGTRKPSSDTEAILYIFREMPEVTAVIHTSAGSIDMGIDTVKYIGDSLAIIMAHHGVMTVGKDKGLKQALYAAVYLEEAAKCYLAAKACGEMKQMTPEQIQQSIEVFKYYGQGTPTIPKDLVKRV